jgi:hypothetical protein
VSRQHPVLRPRHRVGVCRKPDTLTAVGARTVLLSTDKKLCRRRWNKAFRCEAPLSERGLEVVAGSNVVGRLDKHLVVQPQPTSSRPRGNRVPRSRVSGPGSRGSATGRSCLGQVEPAFGRAHALGILIDHQGSLTHQAHLSAQNVEELWELVERRPGGSNRLVVKPQLGRNLRRHRPR